MMDNHWAGYVRRDLLYALRALRRTPGFTVVVVLCLALGTGANTAIFSLLDQVLLRTLPVRNAERLVILHRETQLPGRSSADNMETVFSVPMYRELRDRTRVFDGLIARSGMGVTLAGHEAERVHVDLVSGNFFNVLGMRPELGRLLEPDDDQWHTPRPVAVISYRFWTRHFGGSPTALNSTLLVNGIPATVIGVASSKFMGMVRGDTSELFMPLGMHGQIYPEGRSWSEDRMTRFVNIFGRLRDGVSPERAAVGARAVYQPIVADELSGFRHWTDRQKRELLSDQLQLRPAADGVNQLRGEWQRPLVALAAIAGLVLIIACANISGLILARAASREKDIAVRLALGAGRFAVGRPFLIESIIVALAGGLLGLAIAHWSIAGLLHLLPAGEGNDFLSTAIDGRMLAFSLAVAIVTGILSGLTPAIQASRQDLVVALGSQTRSATSVRTGLRRLLVAGQLALCLMLLVAAGLFTRTLYNIAHVDPGFRPGGITVFSVAPGEARYDEARTREFYRQIHDRIAALPGVQSVASSMMGPFMNSNQGTNVFIEGYSERPGEDVDAERDSISPGYFSTIGTPLTGGREFTDADRDGAPPVALVNEAFARKYFSAGNALGHRVKFSPNEPWREVVGIVRNTSWSDVREKPSPFVFVPWAQSLAQRLHWYLRTRPGYRPAADIRHVVHALDANIPVDGLMEYNLRIERAAYVQRLLAILAGVFGGLATLLAALGLYALIAWTYAQRTAEMGIRIALGASPGNVAAMIAREVGALVLFGIVPGVFAAFAGGALIESQLYGVSARDPLVIILAALVLTIVAALAALLPAIRAARIEPADALRWE